mmetsp:Transcript_8978/g.29390  ORF Transcript_8978/g.29390 Transcript_8978/m.29390 type:complete len:234 (-) Transcript_8978:316-1017(-)
MRHILTIVRGHHSNPLIFVCDTVNTQLHGFTALAGPARTSVGRTLWCLLSQELCAGELQLAQRFALRAERVGAAVGARLLPRRRHPLALPRHRHHRQRRDRRQRVSPLDDPADDDILVIGGRVRRGRQPEVKGAAPSHRDESGGVMREALPLGGRDGRRDPARIPAAHLPGVDTAAGDAPDERAAVRDWLPPRRRGTAGRRSASSARCAPAPPPRTPPSGPRTARSTCLWQVP